MTKLLSLCLIQSENEQKTKQLEEQHSESFKILQTQFEQILALKDKELGEVRERAQATHHQPSNDSEQQRHIEGYEVCIS